MVLMVLMARCTTVVFPSLGIQLEAADVETAVKYVRIVFPGAVFGDWLPIDNAEMMGAWRSVGKQFADYLADRPEQVMPDALIICEDRERKPSLDTSLEQPSTEGTAGNGRDPKEK